MFSNDDAIYPERKAIYTLFSCISLIESLIQKLIQEENQYGLMDRAQIKLFDSKIVHRSKEEKLIALNALYKAVLSFSNENNTFARLDPDHLASLHANSDTKGIFKNICAKLEVEMPLVSEQARKNKSLL